MWIYNVIGLIIILLVLLLIGKAFFKMFFNRVVIYDYEQGLLYKYGKFKKILTAGQYWYCIQYTNIVKIDLRVKTLVVPSQEVLSLDNIPIKINIATMYKIVDPYTFYTKVDNCQEAYYLILQLALREIVGEVKIDDLMVKKHDIGKKLFEISIPKMREYGVDIKEVNIRDIVFPGDIKKVFAKLVTAQKEGLAMLEKTRNETAALRNLANLAKMIENNPNLMNLRALLSLGEGTGNSIVLNLSSEPVKGVQKNTESVSS